MVTYGMLQAFLQGVLELVFPDNCLLCRQFLDSRHQKQLCPKCLASLALNPNPWRRLSSADPVYLDESWSACLYNDAAQKLLHAFKYSGKTSLRKTFVPLMIDFISRHHLPLHRYDLILPIPLHPARLRERGYNQSALLSLDLSRHFGLAHAQDLLMRQKQTQTQTELDAKQRWTNMEAAFRIKNSAAAAGKNMVLVDDLLTTGATANSAAQALKNAGAGRVAVLTFSIA